MEARIVLAADFVNCLAPVEPVVSDVPASVCCMANETAMQGEIPADLDSSALEAPTACPTPANALNFDLTDGSDGMMSTLQGNDSTLITMTVPKDGLMTFAFATAGGLQEGTSLNVELMDAAGNVIAGSRDLVADGAFEMLQAVVSAGDQLTLNLENPCTSAIQVQTTVGIVDLPAEEQAVPSDMIHFTLRANDEVSFLRSLETRGDLDQFQFTPSENGRTVLKLSDAGQQDALNLQLEITDETGAVVARGSTNEVVELAFDSVAGATYTVSVSEAGGVVADYAVALTTQAVAKPEAECSSPEVNANEVDAVATLDANEEQVGDTRDIVTSSACSKEVIVTPACDLPIVSEDVTASVDAEAIATMEPASTLAAPAAEVVSDLAPSQTSIAIGTANIGNMFVYTNPVGTSAQPATVIEAAPQFFMESPTLTSSADELIVDSLANDRPVATDSSTDQCGVTASLAKRSTSWHRGHDRELRAIDDYFTQLGNDLRLAVA